MFSIFFMSPLIWGYKGGEGGEVPKAFIFVFFATLIDAKFFSAFTGSGDAAVGNRIADACRWLSDAFGADKFWTCRRSGIVKRTNSGEIDWISLLFPCFIDNVGKFPEKFQRHRLFTSFRKHPEEFPETSDRICGNFRIPKKLPENFQLRFILFLRKNFHFAVDSDANYERGVGEFGRIFAGRSNSAAADRRLHSGEKRKCDDNRRKGTGAGDAASRQRVDNARRTKRQVFLKFYLFFGDFQVYLILGGGLGAGRQ